MRIIELFLIAVGVFMDAFSVAICKGLSTKELSVKNAIIVGLYFGIFQSLMPIIGYFSGVSFSRFIEQWDHWIVFLILSILGIQMVIEAIKTEECPVGDFSFKSMFPLAIATSIDALAVGVTFAFLKVNIFTSALQIGLCTFIFSAMGVFLGSQFGQRLQKPAQTAGGVILILIGLKLLLKHTGVI